MALFALAPPARAVTQEEITRQIADIEQNLPDLTRRQQLIEVYQQAGELVAAQAAHEAKTQDYRKSATRGPDTRQELIEKAAQLDRAKHVSPITQRELTLDSTALEQLLDQTRAELAARESKLSSYELRLRALAARPAENLRQKALVTARIAELEGQVGVGEASDELGRARAIAIEAELDARNAELEMLNQEQLGHGLREETLRLRREVALLELERLSARTTALEQALIERRQVQTESAQAHAKQAELATSDAHPLAQELARDNQKLTDELAQVNDDQAAAAAHRAEYAERRLQINSEYETAQQRLQFAATSASLGRILVDQRRRMPNVPALQRQAKANAGAISQASLRRIEIDERLASVANAQQDVASYVTGAVTEKADAAELERQVAGLLRAQKEVLENLDANYASLLRVYDAADAELVQLTTTVFAYSELLDQRLLWIPNASTLSSSTFRDAAEAARQAVGNANWRDLGDDLWRSTRALTFQSGLFSLFLILLLRGRPRFERRLAAIASRHKGAYAERIRDTVEVAILTTGIAAPIAMIWWGLGVILRVSTQVTDLSFAIGQTLPTIALLAFASRWVQAAFSAHGLAVSQIDIDPATATRFGRTWRNFGRIFVPAYGAAIALESFGGTIAQHGLFRLLFMTAMVSLAAFGYWMLRSQLVRLDTSSLRNALRFRSALLPLLVVPAIGLLGLSILGYHYTAIQLSKYYLITVACVAGTAALYMIVLKWLRIAATRLEAKYAAEVVATTVSKEQVAQELATFNAQARLILRNLLGWSLAIGVYWVWREVLPALTIFDRINLWDIEIKDTAGILHTQAITLANLALSVIISVITILAARNVPGVIEVGVLQRFRVHHGSRYAISSLLRYAIVAIGTSLALSTLGLRWSQIQWLVAALGVGLGFGLQEIFANFISGLILLFERPIRVGDVVTIGDMTGKVSRIQIRATTIRDPDNKEIIVPNKTFITERFLNWTLSDQVTRIVISIGVAYGTDTEKAMRLLLEAANAHPKVMREPAPEAVLTGFGDSALLFELQVFAEELSHRSNVRHELNSEIYRAFTEHGIEIPYPQRELHLRNIGNVATDGGGRYPDPAAQLSGVLDGAQAHHKR